MKIKHILPVILFSIALFANTQETQSQTKEETIAWIKEKFETYVYDNPACCEVIKSSVKISPCTIVHHTSYGEDGVFSFSIQQTFPVNSNIVIEPAEQLVKGYYWIVPDENNNVVHNISIYKDGKKNEGYHRALEMKNKGEVNLAERMQKALRHLATFCDNKEAF